MFGFEEEYGQSDKDKNKIQQDRSITENDYGGFQWLKKRNGAVQIAGGSFDNSMARRITAAMKQRLQMNVMRRRCANEYC